MVIGNSVIKQALRGLFYLIKWGKWVILVTAKRVLV